MRCRGIRPIGGYRSGQSRQRWRAVRRAAAALCWASLVCAPVRALCADEVQCDKEATALGLRVQAVASAIREPGRDGAMADVVALGTDSRYYTMVRGWLALELQGASSILEAGGGSHREAIEARAEFLRRAIRAIDLE